MGAAYPLAIRTFTQKRNSYDTVEDQHVNDIQEEVVALQTVVGLRPTFDTNTGIEYSSITARLNAMGTRTEGGTPAWEVRNPGLSTFAAADDITRPVPLSPTSLDTDGLANGTGVTIKENGIYVLTANTRVEASAIRGARHLWIMRAPGNGAYNSLLYSSYVTQVADARWSAGRLSVTAIAALLKGDKIAVHVGLYNYGIDKGNYSVFNTFLQGAKLRDL